MSVKKDLINNFWVRVLQHIAFWVMSFYVFLNMFKIGSHLEKIDFVYTALFHVTVIPVVYINLVLLTKLKQNKTGWFIPLVVILILFFSWINYGFFESWSNKILPDYFFISYFSYWQITLFF